MQPSGPWASSGPRIPYDGSSCDLVDHGAIRDQKDVCYQDLCPEPETDMERECTFSLAVSRFPPVKKIYNIYPHYPPVNNDLKNIFPLSA